MNIQSINPVSFKGNITLKEDEKDSLFVSDYYTDDPKVLDELDEIGTFSYGKNFTDKAKSRYFKSLTLNTDNIKGMYKFYNGYDYYSTILYFLPKSKRNIDVTIFSDHDYHNRLDSAYNRVKDNSLSVEV